MARFGSFRFGFGSVRFDCNSEFHSSMRSFPSAWVASYVNNPLNNELGRKTKFLTYPCSLSGIQKLKWMLSVDRYVMFYVCGRYSLFSCFLMRILFVHWVPWTLIYSFVYFSSIFFFPSLSFFSVSEWVYVFVFVCTVVILLLINRSFSMFLIFSNVLLTFLRMNANLILLFWVVF